MVTQQELRGIDVQQQIQRGTQKRYLEEQERIESQTRQQLEQQQQQQEQQDGLYKEANELISRYASGKRYAYGSASPQAQKLFDEFIRSPEGEKAQESREKYSQLARKESGTYNYAKGIYTPLEQTKLPSITEPSKIQSYASGGISRLNPITGKPEYVLPSGVIVPATKETRRAIEQGRSTFEIIASQKITPQIIQSQSRINPITKQPEYVLPSGVVIPSTKETKRAIEQGRSTFEIIASPKIIQQTIKKETRSYLVEPIKPKGYIGKLREKITTKRLEEETKMLRGDETIKPQIKSLFLGGSSSLLAISEIPKNVYLGGKKVITEPVKTIKNIYLGGKEIIGKGMPSLGQSLRENPLYAVGYFGTSFATGTVLGKGVTYFGKTSTEIRAIEKLEKVKPELFVGLEKGEDISTLTILSRKKAGRIQSDTLIKFDVLQTGKKTYQVQAGKGATKITKEKILFRDRPIISQRKFSFYGEAEEGIARIVWESKLSKLTRGLKEPIKGIYSKVGILTIEKNPRLLKSFGMGIQETKKDITRVLTFPIEKARKLKTGEIKVIDLPIGKEKIIKLFESPLTLKSKISSLESMGVVKKIKPKIEIRELKTNGRQLQKVTDKKLELLGTTISLQTEQKILTSLKPELKAVPKIEVLGFLKTGNIQETKLSEPKQISLVSPEINIVEKTKILTPKVDIRIEQEQKTKQIQIQRQIQRQTSENEYKLKPIQKSGTKVDVIQMQYPKQVLGQLLRIRQEQKTKQISKPRQISRPSIKTKVTTRIKPLPILFTGKTKKETGKKITDEFKVFVDKFGKETEVGEFGTLTEARQKLKAELISTIRAGGGIQRGERKLTFEEIGLYGEEFKPSKLSSFKVIQRKEKRLGSRQETSEIQFFKKQKGSNKIF